MRKLTKLVVGLCAVCLLALLSSTSALADPVTQYTLAGSIQAVGILGAGSGTVDVTFGSCAVVSGNSVCTLSGSALTPGGSSTTYTLEELYSGIGSSPVTATEVDSSGIFNIAMNGATAQISFGGGAYSTADYSLISDGSPNPKFSGTWGVSGTPFDYTIANIQSDSKCSLGSTCTLDVVAGSTTASINSPVSSGEFVTPEPASLSLFGIGLLGFAFLFRRQLKATV